MEWNDLPAHQRVGLMVMMRPDGCGFLVHAIGGTIPGLRRAHFSCATLPDALDVVRNLMELAQAGVPVSAYLDDDLEHRFTN